MKCEGRVKPLGPGFLRHRMFTRSPIITPRTTYELSKGKRDLPVRRPLGGDGLMSHDVTAFCSSRHSAAETRGVPSPCSCCKTPIKNPKIPERGTSSGNGRPGRSKGFSRTRDVGGCSGEARMTPEEPRSMHEPRPTPEEEAELQRACFRQENSSVGSRR